MTRVEAFGKWIGVEFDCLRPEDFNAELYRKYREICKGKSARFSHDLDGYRLGIILALALVRKDTTRIGYEVQKADKGIIAACVTGSVAKGFKDQLDYLDIVGVERYRLITGCFSAHHLMCILKNRGLATLIKICGADPDDF